GKLVPARMLVNGASILIDRTINSYTYYHVELESHEAVWAENALTESYLDTGNRSQFDNHTVTAIFGGSKAGGSKTLPL
ncbi:Hint domain-containing protein, partial [Gluconobacter sp. Gdi]|uniref:Hint domain-containing protein n=2 Tax=Acetobacteraceae TaxID=433 RepID=UPI001920B6A8